MKIKTIVQTINDAERFDNEVNAALEDGWVLKKREMFHQSQPTSSAYFNSMLYAELVKEEHEQKEILEEMKQRDYELFVRTQGYSHLSEEQWDWLIKEFSERRKKAKLRR